MSVSPFDVDIACFQNVKGDVYVVEETGKDCWTSRRNSSYAVCWLQIQFNSLFTWKQL